MLRLRFKLVTSGRRTLLAEEATGLAFAPNAETAFAAGAEALALLEHEASRSIEPPANQRQIDFALGRLGDYQSAIAAYAAERAAALASCGGFHTFMIVRKADPARYSTEVACDLYMAAFLSPKTEVPLNYQRAMVPTTGDVRQKLAGGNVYGPLEGAAREDVPLKTGDDIVGMNRLRVRLLQLEPKGIGPDILG